MLLIMRIRLIIHEIIRLESKFMDILPNYEGNYGRFNEKLLDVKIN